MSNHISPAPSPPTAAPEVNPVSVPDVRKRFPVAPVTLTVQSVAMLCLLVWCSVLQRRIEANRPLTWRELRGEGWQHVHDRKDMEDKTELEVDMEIMFRRTADAWREISRLKDLEKIQREQIADLERKVKGLEERNP